jgi:hypothetical protein
MLFVRVSVVFVYYLCFQINILKFRTRNAAHSRTNASSRNFPSPPRVRHISAVLLPQPLISVRYRMTKLGAMVIFNVICEKWNVVCFKYKRVRFMVLVVALKTT